jgi:hypothetical protein
MVGGADSIDDLDLRRHGAMGVLFGGIRAPSTLGSFLRSFTWGNVLQLGKVSGLLLAGLARRSPLLPGREVLAFVDIGSQQRRVYGHKKHGAGVGHTKIQGKELAGPGAERADRHGQHPAGRPGDRWYPAAGRDRELGSRRGVVYHRIGAHRAGRQLHRHDRGADGTRPSAARRRAARPGRPGRSSRSRWR